MPLNTWNTQHESKDTPDSKCVSVIPPKCHTTRDKKQIIERSNFTKENQSEGMSDAKNKSPIPHAKGQILQPERKGSSKWNHKL